MIIRSHRERERDPANMGSAVIANDAPEPGLFHQADATLAEDGDGGNGKSIWPHPIRKRFTTKAVIIANMNRFHRAILCHPKIYCTKEVNTSAIL